MLNCKVKVTDPTYDSYRKTGRVKHQRGMFVYVELDDSKNEEGVPEQVKLRYDQVQEI